MQLRPHQKLAIDMLRHSLQTGHKRPILAAPCSFGKTITAAYILNEVVNKGKRAVIICDRIKLIEQTLEAYDGMGLEFGVIQGDHWRTDYSKPLQIASAQTLARRLDKFGIQSFPWDLAIVDEAHTHYKYLTRIMEQLNAIPFIGMTATPYSKGLGKYYDDLIVPTTSRELLAGGYLCPVDYYSSRRIALEGVKTRAIPTGGRDYDERDLVRAIDSDKALNGDIIENWKRRAFGRMTIAFTPSINHSKELVRQFQAAGISAEHVDGYMDPEEREDIIQAHTKGEFLILSCSKLLNTGFDSTGVSCILDAYPTRSLITWIQRIGRGMRTHPGKQNCIVLDHAGNVEQFGCFAEDFVPAYLDDGEKEYNERNLVKDKEEKEAKTHDCPQCYRKFIGIRCSCGYEIPIAVQIETTQEELQKVEKAEAKIATREEKISFYRQLVGYASSKGYKEHWVDHKYREKYGSWYGFGDKHNIQPQPLTPEVANWIKSRQIAWAYSKSK